MQKAGLLDFVHRHQLLPASDLERSTGCSGSNAIEQQIKTYKESSALTAVRQLLVASHIKNGWPHAIACFVYVSKLTPMAFLILAFARCLAPSTSTPWRDR